MSGLRPDVSIVITAHREGVVAHKTVLSLLKGAEGLDALGLSYEFIVGLDCADEATRSYYARYDDDERFTVLESNFANPAENRNNCVAHASGSCIAMLDGDDMVSANWLAVAWQTLASQAEEVIVHPNGHLHFDAMAGENSLWLMHDSFSLEEDALLLSYWNRWDVVAFARRETFERFPYRPSKDGFGPEDYLFNVETRAAGIRHLVAPGTMMFYRQMASSTSRQHVAENVVLPPCELFRPENIKAIEVTATRRSKGSSGHGAGKLAKAVYSGGASALGHFPGIKAKLSPAASRIMHKRRLRELPGFVTDAWREINAIDNSLYPCDSDVIKLGFHPLSFDAQDSANNMGLLYKQMSDALGSSIDYLFMAPEISVGGTEKLIANYASALASLHPEWRFAVVTAVPTNGRYKPPNGVAYIPFGDIMAGQSDYNRNRLFTLLLVQMGVKRLHIINEAIWYKWAFEHCKLLEANGYSVYASLFMREYTREPGWLRSFADPWLVAIEPVLTKVMADNLTVIRQTQGNNALPKSKLAVHYQPEGSTHIPPRRIDPDKPLRVLWASRLSLQKRLDVLKAVAERLDPQEFTVFAYGREQEYKPSYLSGVKALRYMGAFSGPASLPLEDFDAYLYTSCADGMPNILLEMAAAGLPIIASNAGGVGEFVIDGCTGRLVEIEAVDAYVEALLGVKSNPEAALRMAASAQELLKKRHSFEGFLEKVRRDFAEES